VDSEGNTPLVYAILENHLSMLRFLLQKGAAVNEKQNGKLPLERAVELNLTKFAQVLIDFGASTDGMPLQLAAYALKKALQRNDVTMAECISLAAPATEQSNRRTFGV